MGVVLHEDGVFEIFSLKYGMAVLADHEAVEVKTFQWALRNLACGLCGDMNDEKTADLKSAGKCVMSQPKLAALSYMVEDGQCEGIPAQLKPVYQKEASECKKCTHFHKVRCRLTLQEQNNSDMGCGSARQDLLSSHHRNQLAIC